MSRGRAVELVDCLWERFDDTDNTESPALRGNLLTYSAKTMTSHITAELQAVEDDVVCGWL